MIVVYVDTGILLQSVCKARTSKGKQSMSASVGSNCPGTGAGPDQYYLLLIRRVGSSIVLLVWKLSSHWSRGGTLPPREIENSHASPPTCHGHTDLTTRVSLLVDDLVKQLMSSKHC